MLIWLLICWFIPAIILSCVATWLEVNQGRDFTVIGLFWTLVVCIFGPFTVFFIIVYFFGNDIKTWFNNLKSTVILKGKQK